MSESVGKILKKIRESKHLSIEEISERTRTPKKIISAIEEDRLHEISLPFYAKGFIRSYSEFLGAMEQNVVREYLSGGRKKEDVVPASKPEKTVIEWKWFQRHKRYIGIGILAIFGIWMLSFSFTQFKKMVTSMKVAAKPALPTGDLGRVSARAADSEKKEGIELEITARYNTWIQITGNGELLFKGILEKGTTDIWHVEKEIQLEVGNAGGVTLKLNGKDLGSPGRRDEKKSIVVTKDGIKPR